MKDNNMYDKILGSFVASAVGDAIGAATENLSRDKILENFNGELREFVAPPKTAFAYGNVAGEITDDFSLLYFLAEEIINDNGVVSEEATKKTLLRWSTYPQYFNRFAGPSTRSAILEMQGISQKREGVTEDLSAKATNGAAMKISPVGIINPGNLDKVIEDTLVVTKVTHNNHLAISGACAVSCAVSQALLDGSTLIDVINAGYYGAVNGEKIGREKSNVVGGASVIKRMDLALSIALSSKNLDDKIQDLSDIVGSGLHISEAVPCAFGILVATNGDLMEAVFRAINIGYDTDTVATIVGSIAGALYGAKSIENLDDYIKVIDENNDIDLKKISLDMFNIAERNLAD